MQTPTVAGVVPSHHIYSFSPQKIPGNAIAYPGMECK